ncbi:hypothetical protein [Heyndrickxia ginsengihumi]|uniref:hypothetical protein n=1 Tax=Heyndrickxia ginsengihumi TaxID=363870 RepID=UPI000470FE7C|nr:hypothetical protein [Heyndrickxia ginsengihumi]
MRRETPKLIIKLDDYNSIPQVWIDGKDLTDMVNTALEYIRFSWETGNETRKQIHELLADYIDKNGNGIYQCSYSYCNKEERVFKKRID